MKLFGRLAVVLVPLAVGLVSMALPGRAQTPSQSGRYAFADTTTGVLRDTLGIKFDEVFPLADSMHTSPDTLRALAIRYRAPLRAIVRMTDSLAVPMDSVSAVMDRERFNPLAAVAGRSNSYTYGSQYTVNQTTSNWSNSSTWRYTSSQVVVNQTTSLTMNRLTGGELRVQKDGTSATDVSWRFTPDFSAGTKVELARSFDIGGVSDLTGTTNSASFSFHARSRPSRNTSLEFDLLPGWVDMDETQGLKRAASIEMRGRARYVRGNALTHDVTVRMTGNTGSTGLPGSAIRFPTRDYSPNVDGTLGLFTNSRLGANLNYRVHYSLTNRPTLNGLQKVISQDNGADLTVRAKSDENHSLTVLGSVGSTRQAQNNPLNVTAPTSFTTGRTLSLKVTGRYELLGTSLDTEFDRNFGIDQSPNRGPGGGYGDSTHYAQINFSASRPLGPRIQLLARGFVNLTQTRVFTIGAYSNPPVNNDAYQQDYFLEADYNVSEDFKTSVNLDVRRTLALNLPAAATSSNSETRAYSAIWTWTCRLLPNLVANQRNLVTANYLLYTFRPQSSRLNMFYDNLTTLTSRFSSRFYFDVSHHVTYQPGGNYVPQPDGLYAFSLSDQLYTYTLESHFNYLPIQALQFQFTPSYTATNNNTTASGVLVPSQRVRQLSYNASTTLTLPIGRRGQLSGTMSRIGSNSRTIQWDQGVQGPALLATTRPYFYGNLSLTWNL